MKISKKSWHYKVYDSLFTVNSYRLPSTCVYWLKVASVLFIIATVLLVFLPIIGSLFYIIFLYPLGIIIPAIAYSPFNIYAYALSLPAIATAYSWYKLFAYFNTNCKKIELKD